MRVRVEQLNPTVGDIDANSSLILEALERAGEARIDLLVLPEMIVTGYPPMDLLENEQFRRACLEANRRLISDTGATALLFGTVTRSSASGAPALCNSALLARNGELLGRVDKTLLPVYDIFDEKRYFAENREIACLELDGVRLGVTICEDIWYNENETGEALYGMDPASELKLLGARALINISASPYTERKHQNRERVLCRQASALELPLFYVNQTGAQTDVLFDGDSQVIGPSGELICRAEPFRSTWQDVDWEPDGQTLSRLDTATVTSVDSSERLFRGLCTGIRDYLEKSSVADELILGLSGGIDSALVAVLAVETVGPERVTLLTMPSKFSSEGSVQDSELLADRLGVRIHNLSIQPLFEESLETLESVFGNRSFGVAEENLQSRLRGLLLMACSNKLGPMLLTTGNKSELAVGYATLYGDMNGSLNPIGDLYKTGVYRLCRWLNTDYYGQEIIPKSILEKPPSAELRPDQRDEDTLPPYTILDNILVRYLERQQGADMIIGETGYESDLVHRVLRLVDANEFKRYQAPPILKVSPKAFGSGRRWPMVQGWTRCRESVSNPGG